MLQHGWVILPSYGVNGWHKMSSIAWLAEQAIMWGLSIYHWPETKKMRILNLCLHCAMNVWSELNIWLQAQTHTFTQIIFVKCFYHLQLIRFPPLLHRLTQCANIHNLYLKGTQFKYQLKYQLSWLKFFIVIQGESKDSTLK
jgi:hypothetical protein